MACSGPTEVLIVGAGPTGLVLALWLNRLRVRLRIVDRAPGTGEASRALGIQARTLEFYQAFGLAESIVAEGLPARAINLWVRKRKQARIPFGSVGEGLSPFPSVLMLSQSVHERILAERLHAEGVDVEWETELIGFADDDSGVLANLRCRGGTIEDQHAQYLCGCDGAHSTVRENLGIGFPGGTYSQRFYVADVEARGAVVDGELHISFEEADFCLVFPMKGTDAVRLVGLVDNPPTRRDDLAYEEVSGGAEQGLGLMVERVNWFSTYQVHHRVADAFSRGRHFLLGDAAHVHSPAGAQGMNTGIGDAVNLAWKLAMVIDKRAGEDILDTYDSERRAFARRLVRTTDQAFRAAVDRSAVARFIRMRVVPVVLPAAMSWGAVRRLAFRTVSQISVNYRGSRLSQGGSGSIKGGDRLPWLVTNDTDNFGPMRSLAWHVQVYGSAKASLVEWCRQRELPAHTFAFGPEAQRAGFKRDVAYLVRPDGHVACVATDQDPEVYGRFLSARGLSPGGIRP